MPLWVVLAADAAIGAGTLSGGWRIVKTMGSKITRLQPVGGFAVESAAAVALFYTNLVLAILVALESLSSRSRRGLVEDEGES